MRRPSQHAALHSQTRSREQRARLAQEAARLIAEGGIRDFHQAKRKAALRLGIHDDSALPRNREIEDALREHQRLFGGDDHRDALRHKREAALAALAFFAVFQPRLVGPVLAGTADAHSPVQLHLHTDDPDAVARVLLDTGVPAEARSRRLRLDQERMLDVPVWLFAADGVGIDAAVLPAIALRQAPLSTVDEKPMPRASAAQLSTLLAEEDIAGYEER
jgi:hypothetical protein